MCGPQQYNKLNMIYKVIYIYIYLNTKKTQISFKDILGHSDIPKTGFLCFNSNQWLICCFLNRGEKSMDNFKETEIGFNNIFVSTSGRKKVEPV